ncbi:hypothetical protein AEB_P1751 [Altererythrobacter sp. B11]|uniref:hypothetical protein n=1 Tax=Altererythrobacter sp. B11 TaxID=2060312 RepID=UPI000DC6E281|nr:hypothetical protein [Altererythrobacter sp. B11]BBC72619.1 hypothetical protein AEB_P1751 [Altererythrobacter sp. B11]
MTGLRPVLDAYLAGILLVASVVIALGAGKGDALSFALFGPVIALLVLLATPVVWLALTFEELLARAAGHDRA